MPPVRMTSVLTVLLALLASLAPTASPATTSPKPIVVTITESKVKFSATSVAVGPAVFKVVNKGKTSHVFKIGGKSTPKIAVETSATIQIVIANKGPYVYYSVARANAAALTGGLSVVEPCTKPTSSTVTVKMEEAPITLSQMTLPCGTVTFVVTNAGTVVHSFDLFQPNPPRVLLQGAALEPGQTGTAVVHMLLKGAVNYSCGQSEHGEEYGEIGSLTVI